MGGGVPRTCSSVVKVITRLHQEESNVRAAVEGIMGHIGNLEGLATCHCLIGKTHSCEFLSAIAIFKVLEEMSPVLL